MATAYHPGQQMHVDLQVGVGHIREAWVILQWICRFLLDAIDKDKRIGAKYGRVIEAMVRIQRNLFDSIIKVVRLEHAVSC
jgi:hypothetical protein